MLILQWYKGQRGKAKKPITQQLVMNVKQVSSCQSYGEIEKLNKNVGILSPGTVFLIKKTHAMEYIQLTKSTT